MFLIFRIMYGVHRLVDQRDDFEVARVRARELSAVEDAVFYVVRDGFGEPLVWAYRGNNLAVVQVMQALTKPNPKPVLTIDPPEPEAVEEAPKTRRPRKAGPTEVKGTTGPDEHKAFPTLVTNVDEDQGLVTAVVSVMGNIDDGDDIIHPGAFVKTIAERFERIRALNHHNGRDVLSIVGRPVSIREIGRAELPAKIAAKYPEATGGLETVTQYMLDDPTSLAVFKRIKLGLVEYSIGFDAVDTDLGKAKMADGTEKVVRNIRQARLWEYSPVIWGMNPSTATVSVKSTDGQSDSEEIKQTDEPMPEPDALAVPLLAEWLSTQLQVTATSLVNGLAWGGVLEDEAEQVLLSELCRRHIDDLRNAIPLGIGLRPMTNGGMIMMQSDGADETKVGRVLSEKNYQAIKQAYELLNQVMKSAGLNDGDEADKAASQHDSSEHKTDGPLVPTTAPTSQEAGPQGDKTPAMSPDDLRQRFDQLMQEITLLEVKT